MTARGFAVGTRRQDPVEGFVHVARTLRGCDISNVFAPVFPCYVDGDINYHPLANM